jgi:hypothetical protein
METLPYETPRPPEGKPWRVLIATGIVVAVTLLAVVALLGLFFFLGMQFGWLTY